MTGFNQRPSIRHQVQTIAFRESFDVLLQIIEKNRLVKHAEITDVPGIRLKGSAAASQVEVIGELIQKGILHVA